MRLAIATASFGIHMVLVYSVVASMFFHQYGYYLSFPEQEQVERIDRFYVDNYSCICPRNLAERRRYSQMPVCLRSQCNERWNPSRVAA
jgi:hypothetical protein